MAGPLPRSHIATLAEKLRDGHLGLFVGAGLSRLAPATDGSARRLPLWNELAKEVALACKVRVSAYRNILDLFDGIAGKRDRPTLERAVREALDDKPFAPSPAHLALRELPWSAIFTTNYDGLLARTFDKTPFFEERDYEKLEERRDEAPLLFHLHGTLDWPHTLTRDDYRSWRGKNRGAFLNLQKFVHDKTLLFVGYSLSDPHIDDLLALVRDITSGRPKEMFAWMWRLTKEDQELLADRDKIHAFPIRKEEDWAKAFGQLNSAMEPTRTAVGVPVSKATSPLNSVSAGCSQDEPEMEHISNRAARPRSVHLVGRDQAVNQILQHICKQVPEPIAILGNVGIGKSAICWNVFNDDRVMEIYGPNRYFVSLVEVDIAEDMVAKMARQMLLPIGRSDHMKLISSHMKERRTLLILDSLEDPLNYNGTDTKSNLADLSRNSGSTFIASIKGNVWPSGVLWYRFTLAGLSDEDTKSLFLQLAGGRFSDDPQLEDIIATTGGVPGAIELMALKGAGCNESR